LVEGVNDGDSSLAANGRLRRVFYRDHTFYVRRLDIGKTRSSLRAVDLVVFVATLEFLDDPRRALERLAERVDRGAQALLTQGIEADLRAHLHGCLLELARGRVGRDAFRECSVTPRSGRPPRRSRACRESRAAARPTRR
jgi:hypothetical protein